MQKPWSCCITPGLPQLFRAVAGENFTNMLPQTYPKVECTTSWQSGLLRHIFPDEIQMAYHPCGGAEYVLPVVSRQKVKSRQRAGSRSGKYHLRPGLCHGLTPKFKPYPSSSETSVIFSSAYIASSLSQTCILHLYRFVRRGD